MHVRLDRQPQARERADARRAAGDGKPDFGCADEAAVRLHALDAALLDAEAGDLAILDDVDAAFIGGAGIAPGHGVVAHRAAARLHQRAANREPGIVEIGEGQIFAHLVARQQLGIDTGETHGVAPPHIGVPLRVRMEDVEDAALADHGVEVELLAQPLPQLHRALVEGGVARQQIVRANDRGVAPDIAGAEIALLQHGDIGDAMLLGEVIGGGETMPAADNDHVVSRLRLRLPPGLRPAAIAGEPLLQEGEGRIAHGSSWARAPRRLDT